MSSYWIQCLDFSTRAEGEVKSARQVIDLMKPSKTFLTTALLMSFAASACSPENENEPDAPHSTSEHSTSSHTASHVQYIANAAILVSRGETKVMFDPLPLSGFGTYPETPTADVAQMMNDEGAYAGIDVVFISHAHSDHFAAASMIAYMNAQPGVRLVAPKQALELMQADEGWNAELLARMTIIDMEAGTPPELITIGDIHAEAVRIPHAGWPAPARASIQNMVYRVTLGEDATIMHMGDADPNHVHFTPHKEHWNARQTDTAFPPYWFLVSDEGRDILNGDLNASKSIGVHVPIKVPEALKESGQDYFSVSGETREIRE